MINTTPDVKYRYENRRIKRLRPTWMRLTRIVHMGNYSSQSDFFQTSLECRRLKPGPAGNNLILISLLPFDSLWTVGLRMMDSPSGWELLSLDIAIRFKNTMMNYYRIDHWDYSDELIGERRAFLLSTDRVQMTTYLTYFSFLNPYAFTSNP